MNPYAAPGTRPQSAEEDIAAATPPAVARIAGGLVALAGIVVTLTGAQTLAMVTIRGPLAVVPYALALLGVGEIVAGTLVFRARAWGAIAAVGSSAIDLLASGAWLIVSVGHGLLSLYALASPCVAIVAGIMAFVAMGPCERASAARRRLREQGMDLGI
jgi:hypothetical protein